MQSEAALGDRARQKIEELLQRYRSEPAALTTLLVELRKQLGLLPEAAVHVVALKLRLPPAPLVELARRQRLVRGAEEPLELGVCINGACAARGGNEVERVLREKGLPFEMLRCQGACDLGPIACYRQGPPLSISAARARTLAKADPEQWEDLLSVEKPVHAFKTEPRVAFANIFAKGSHQLATARRHGVYAPVEKALEASPDSLLAAVREAGLREVDGAFVSEKWDAVRSAGGARHLVINGVESEPGSIKERVLLERDPHLVLAGALLAAYGTGARSLFLVVRAEYELAIERTRAAVEEAFRAGLWGERSGGPAAELSVRVRLLPASLANADPAGLLDALEARAPDAAPGSPGLFGEPTVVHGVEVAAMLPAIAANGGVWFQGLGLEGGAGTTVASLCGDLKRPGTYEVPRGIPLRQLVEGLGDGPAQGKVVVAVQVGGAREPYLPSGLLDVRLDEASLAPHGARVGTGSVMVISEKSCLFDHARRETSFFVREGCDRCEGCRQLLPELEATLERLVAEGDSAGARVLEIAGALRARGCSLSRRAGLPAASVVERFPEAIREHREGLCACNPKRRPAPPK